MPAHAGIHNRDGNGDISRNLDPRVREDDRSSSVENICITQCEMGQGFSPVNRWRSSAYGEPAAAQKRQMRSWGARRRRGVAAARPRDGRRLKAAADRRSRPEKRELRFAEQGVILPEQDAFAQEQGGLRAREPDARVGPRQVRRNTFGHPGAAEATNARVTDPAPAGRRGGAPAARTAPEVRSEPQPQCKEQGAPQCRTGRCFRRTRENLLMNREDFARRRRPNPSGGQGGAGSAASLILDFNYAAEYIDIIDKLRFFWGLTGT